MLNKVMAYYRQSHELYQTEPYYTISVQCALEYFDSLSIYEKEKLLVVSDYLFIQEVFTSARNLFFQHSKRAKHGYYILENESEICEIYDLGFLNFVDLTALEWGFIRTLHSIAVYNEEKMLDLEEGIFQVSDVELLQGKTFSVKVKSDDCQNIKQNLQNMQNIFITAHYSPLRESVFVEIILEFIRAERLTPESQLVAIILFLVPIYENRIVTAYLESCGFVLFQQTLSPLVQRKCRELVQVYHSYFTDRRIDWKSLVLAHEEDTSDCSEDSSPTETDSEGRHVMQAFELLRFETELQ